MPSARPTSSQAFTRARRILVGGVNSPVRAFAAVKGRPPFITRGKGAHLTDQDGRRYLDYVMSWGPLIHGHAPAGLTRALTAAAAKGTSFGAPTILETTLAEHVCALIPSVEKLRFVNSGTEATMSAIRVARAATKRDKILKFKGCYHGHTDSLLVDAGSGALTLGIPSSPGVPKGVANDTLVANYNDLDSVKHLFRTHRQQIAAVIVEPIAGNMGVVLPASGFLEGLRELCNQNDSLLIFDEVISGFRVSKGGAQSLLDVHPDLTCLGKIIGGGLPVGAYGGAAEFMSLVAPMGEVYQAGTLSGNPLAMTAGLWSLKRLSNVLYRRLSRMSGRLTTGLTKAAKDAGVNVQVNSAESLLTPFFTAKPVNDYHSAVGANTKKYAAFFHAMLGQGIYPPPSQFEAWFLSGAHTDQNVEHTIKASQKAMRAAKRA